MEDIAACAGDMTEFLKESGLSKRRAFIENFVSEIVVMFGKIVIRYNVPMPDGRHKPGADFEEVPLGS